MSYFYEKFTFFDWPYHLISYMTLQIYCIFAKSMFADAFFFIYGEKLWGLVALLATRLKKDWGKGACK